jgi:glycosyltransferase involved in cell wall biosynthesis
MNLLWLTWKDKKHPLAGGAELVNEELTKRLVKDGHKVIFIVGGFPGGKSEEKADGYKIIRLGNKWTVYWQAYRYYKKNLVGWADLVIDEVNTIPFFAKFYVKEKNILFIHQLCREIWFYQMSFPLSLIGYLLEPVYLRLLSDRKVITVSESSKKDIMRFGFKAKNIKIISEGIEIEPLSTLNFQLSTKSNVPTLLAFGAIKAMKRTDQIIEAFEIAKEKIKTLRLVASGKAEGKYGKRILKMIKKSKYKGSIEYLGKVNKGKKIEIMQKAHLLCVTSVKEGWGIIVTEANSQGTPAVVYNVDGLRDSVKNNQTGLITKEDKPNALAEKIVELIQDKKKYAKLQKAGWQWSKEINFENSYKQFVGFIKL